MSRNSVSERTPKVSKPAAPSFRSPWYSAPRRSPTKRLALSKVVKPKKSEKDVERKDRSVRLPNTVAVERNAPPKESAMARA